MSVIKKLQEARDLFECSICHSEYNDPRLLVCNHSFCLTCLQQWAQQRTNQHRRIVCPTCKAVTPISENNPVEKLPVDFKVNAICDAFSDVIVSPQFNRSISGNIIHCDICLYAEASVCCTDCRKQLCQECQEKHKRHRLFKDHNIESFEDKSCLKCDIHESETIKYFCKTCNKAVCTLCALGDHEEHNTGTLEEGLLQCQQNLRGLIHPLGLRKKLIIAAITEASHTERQMEKALVRSQELIERKADSMVAEVQEWESHLKKTLLEQFQKSKQKHEQYVQELTETTEVINNLCESINASVRQSSINLHIVSNYGNTMSKFKALTSSEPQELEMKIPCFNEDISLSPFLESLDAIRQKEVRISDYEDYELPQQKMQWQITERSAKIGGLISPVSVSFSPKQDILVSEVDNNRVQMFDSTGKSIGMIKYKGVKCAISHPNSQIYLVNAEFPGVVVCDEEGTQIDHWGMTILPCPRGLAVNKDGNVLVSDKKTCKITVHTENGDLLHSTEGKLLRCPVSLCTDSQNRIIVADRDQNLVQIFSPECQPIFSIIPDIIYQNSEGIHVVGVCTDLADHIFVVLHETQKIIKYSPSGECEGDVLTRQDGLAWPTAIATYIGGVLAVVESKVPKSHSALKLFKLY